METLYTLIIILSTVIIFQSIIIIIYKRNHDRELSTYSSQKEFIRRSAYMVGVIDLYKAIRVSYRDIDEATEDLIMTAQHHPGSIDKWAKHNP